MDYGFLQLLQESMALLHEPDFSHNTAFPKTWGYATKPKFPIGSRQVQKIVKEFANRAQISKTVTPHILRHTFATLALQKNISLASVQKILGHDRLATTSIYLNFTDEHVVDEFVRKW